MTDVLTFGRAGDIEAPAVDVEVAKFCPPGQNPVDENYARRENGRPACRYTHERGDSRVMRHDCPFPPRHSTFLIGENTYRNFREVRYAPESPLSSPAQSVPHRRKYI